MRIAYLYNTPSAAADPWGVEKRFVDYEATRRQELRALIEQGGLCAGDVLVIAAKSHLGHGRESTRMQGVIAALGVEIEIIPIPKKPVKKRSGWLVPGDDQKQLICGLWFSPEPAAYVLERAGEIMGEPVDRNWLNRHCGKRSAKTET
jgi:hypothetical protein